MIRAQMIVFFYVDDIGFLFPKAARPEAEKIVVQLKDKYELTGGGEIDWFLGIQVIRDRRKKLLLLSQSSYIDKIFQTCLPSATEPDRRVNTPMVCADLARYEGIVDKRSRFAYQRKIGSIQYAAIITRPDIAFACSKLARFNQNPGPVHHDAADRVLHYLKNTRSWAIQFDGHVSCNLFASDASFADDVLSRRSSQGYVMLFCGGPAAWRASLQDTVTTSTTEAELLAIAETAKESIFLSRLLRELDETLDKRPVIQCDNKQTVRLLVEDSATLSTKLRHVDIHRHWLRQEVQQGRVAVEWVPTGEMLADGLTKALPGQKFNEFRHMIGMIDAQGYLGEGSESD